MSRQKDDMPDWEIVHSYLEDRLSLEKIALKFGCSRNTIKNRLLKLGISIRTYKEACANINKGATNPMFGKSGSASPTFGLKRPDVSRRLKERQIAKKGSENPFWKPPHLRRTTVYNALRASTAYQKWRLQVFERDGFACVFCGDAKGGNLNADHIHQFAKIIQEHKITSLEQGFECKPLWDISNGRTLCESCHRKTPTFGKKIQ